MKKILLRTLCIVFAAMFILTFVLAAVISSNAEENAPQRAEIDELDTANAYFKDAELFLRVGITYSDLCEEGYRIRPSHALLGFDLYKTEFKGSFDFIYTLNDCDVFFAKGGNLYKHTVSSSSSEYRTASSVSDATVGGFHILLPMYYHNFRSMDEDIAILSELYAENVFIPSYIHGEYRILFGSYFTEEEAAEALDGDIFNAPVIDETTATETETSTGSESASETEFDTDTATDTTEEAGTFTDTSSDTISQEQTETDTQIPIEDIPSVEFDLSDSSLLIPGDTEIVLLDYLTGDFLFYFDTDGEYGFGCYPNKIDGEYNYLKTADGYYRPGVFEFKRYNGDGVDGISMVTVSEIEEYVESVVPWEIYTTWPLETIKAFAITVRTFAVSNIVDSKHAKYGIDVCSTSNCQVSKGHSRVDDIVRRAVAETKGMILTCDGKTAGISYSAVTGGSIAASHQVWNQPAQKYLIGQFTPWERYETHKYGNWQFEATPEKLCRTLRNDGFTQFKDAIADVEILELCENSSYVYKIRVTDIHGTSAVIVRSRNVYHALEDYLYAANFVIMRDGVIDDGTGDKTGIYVMTENGLQMIPKNEQINVITSTGIKTSSLPNILSVQTSSGPIELDVLNEAKKFVESAVNASNSESNFIFIGKGNGHGAGMSQLGIRDLADLGYKCDEILYKYFPYTEVTHYSEYLD